MRNVAAVLILTALGLGGLTGSSWAADVAGDTTWKGEVTVAEPVRVTQGTLTIEPGTRVVFKNSGKIGVESAGALVAKGTAEKPVVFAGQEAGVIECNQGKVLLEHCRLEKVGLADGNKRVMLFSGSSGKGGIVVRDSQMEGCGGIWLAVGGPIELSGNDIRNSSGGIRIWGAGDVRITGNTIFGSSMEVGEGAAARIAENIIVHGTISTWRVGKDSAIESNYVHNDYPRGSYCIASGSGIIRNNVLRGSAWVTGKIQGEITGNVLESLPSAHLTTPGDRDREGTHEHICGLAPGSKVVRNIFVGQSYGGVMGIGDATCSDSVIRNNTFDMRGRGNAIFLNHLPARPPKNVVIRNNIFMRSGPVVSEEKVPDSISSVDYNLWSESGAKGRFSKIEIAGKKEGDAGFGAHDVPPPAEQDKPLSPAAVVANPEFQFPYSDEEMLARKHTVKECLELYRQAYALKPGSAAINAGEPADKGDAEVTDGKPDIGAIEFKP